MTNGDCLHPSPKGEVCNSSTNDSCIDEVSEHNAALLEAKGRERGG